MKSKQLLILQSKFINALTRDVELEPIYELVYLDLETGDILEIKYEYGYPHEIEIIKKRNQPILKKIKISPERYLQIPGLFHKDHHYVLVEFLNSDWNDDKKFKDVARNAYLGSIGGWIRNVDENTVKKYRDFCKTRNEQLAEEFLRDHGIHPIWKGKARAKKVGLDQKKSLERIIPGREKNKLSTS